MLYSFQYTDLDLLMYMTVRNLERENSKLWETCRFALRSARASQMAKQRYGESVSDEESTPMKDSNASDDYYSTLEEKRNLDLPGKSAF